MPPFAPNGFAYNGFGGAAPPRGPSGNATVNLAVDNMIRNQLKVADVRDPNQIAAALLNYYRDLPVAAAVRQEALGLPFLQAPASAAALPPPRPTSSDAEFQIADNDIEKALQDLATSPLTVDIIPEMQGWADSIRSAIAQGYTAARQGLDPTQRDKVIAIRRQLGEYGRLARFVGSLSPGMTPNYRRLGQALDETAAVLLVMLGESLASVGFASGYYLLQVPLAELQQRRDSVIFALRNFMGGAQQAYGPDDWPRGIDAYRRLYNWLEQQGQGDLRSLLIENEIAESMDALISRAQNGTAEGLRALGVTAQLDIERFRRMAIIAPGAMSRNGHYDRSPPLEAYLQAIELFADTFRPAGGLRLMRIARPAILFYGIYNPNVLEDDRDLVELVMIRGNLATILDSLFSAAGARSVDPQVLLDMLLLELDRGIDLLALDANPKERGPTVRRALAYWMIINVIQNLLQGRKYITYTNPLVFADSLTDPFDEVLETAGSASVSLGSDALNALINNIQPPSATTRLWVYIGTPSGASGPYPVTVVFSPPASASAHITLPIPSIVGSGISIPTPPPTLPWGGRMTLIYVTLPLAASPTAAVIQDPISSYAIRHPSFGQVLEQIASAYHRATTTGSGLNRALAQYSHLRVTQVPTSGPIDRMFLEAVLEELRVQESLEDRWQNLVRTVAPEAGDQQSVFQLLKLVIEQAQYDANHLVSGTATGTALAIPLRIPYEQRLPPQFEQSLAEIVRNTQKPGPGTSDGVEDPTPRRRRR